MQREGGVIVFLLDSSTLDLVTIGSNGLSKFQSSEVEISLSKAEKGGFFFALTSFLKTTCRRSFPTFSFSVSYCRLEILVRILFVFIYNSIIFAVSFISVKNWYVCYLCV
ncbi:hypothetical protein BDF21DRAFT_431122 [Thamnidium elegans]|nr:hypothetical protein BDF21DRAFT_431122 [Thamnidium elegans]